MAFPSVASNPIDGAELLTAEQRANAGGVTHRPLGPARFELVTGDDLYTAALAGRPYRVRGLVNFGANMVMAMAAARGGAMRSSRRTSSSTPTCS